MATSESVSVSVNVASYIYDNDAGKGLSLVSYMYDSDAERVKSLVHTHGKLIR